MCRDDVNITPIYVRFSFSFQLIFIFSVQFFSVLFHMKYYLRDTFKEELINGQISV